MGLAITELNLTLVPLTKPISDPCQQAHIPAWPQHMPIPISMGQNGSWLGKPLLGLSPRDLHMAPTLGKELAPAAP